MKLEGLLLVLLAILMAASVVSAQDTGVDQLKQMMEKSAGNLTTYTYLRYAQSDLHYFNSTTKTQFSANKATKGKVDLIDKA